MKIERPRIEWKSGCQGESFPPFHAVIFLFLFKHCDFYPRSRFVFVDFIQRSFHIFDEKNISYDMTPQCEENLIQSICFGFEEIKRYFFLSKIRYRKIVV